MAALAAALLFAANIALTLAKPQTSNAIDYSEDRIAEEDRYKALIKELCKYRPANEYFRLSAESNCRDVVRCVSNDFIGKLSLSCHTSCHTSCYSGGHTLAAVRCPTGLLFDLDGQVCDWAAKVEATGNCERLTKPRIAYPNLNTDSPVCPDGQLQCGDGECINRQLFCDTSPDCR